MKEAVTIISFIGLMLSALGLFAAFKNGHGSKVKPFICLILFGAIFLYGFVTLFSSAGTIYSHAEVRPVYNGSETKKLGEYSVCEVLSEDCTEEALADWFFDYVDKHDYNWCMVLYSDKDDLSGVYAIKSEVIKDVKFAVDESGQYYVSESIGKPRYVPDHENRTLKRS